jgi:exonuclease III
MKVISWNIQAAAGERLTRITAQLAAWDADVLALSETTATRVGELTAALKTLGYAHIHAPSHPKDRGVLIAARHAFKARASRDDLELPGHRWVEVEIDRATRRHGDTAKWILVCAHFPSTGAAIRAFWPKAYAALEQMRERSVLFVGDLNSGSTAFDSTTSELSSDPWFTAMPLLGYTDLWRRQHRAALEYTWESTHKNGGKFRIDHAFGTEALRRRVRDCRYLHEGRHRDRSDHSAVAVELR